MGQGLQSATVLYVMLHIKTNERLSLQAMKNLTSLAKPGAPIVVGGDLDTSYYVVEENKFPVLPLTAEMVHEYVEKAGCKVTSLKVKNVTIPSVISDCKGVYVVEACRI